MVTAGPTYEKIDPVRFIGNYSSGKMGYAIADELAKRGAKVLLVSGPVSIKPKESFVEVYKVESALEMYEKVRDLFPVVDGAIFAAAVADYRPQHRYDEKIKRDKSGIEKIELVKNPDIAAETGKIKKDGQITVGFALETDNELENAQEKLHKKNLDFIVLNSLKDKGAGFGTDTNKITIVDKHNKKQSFGLKSKTEVASDIVDYLEKIMFDE